MAALVNISASWQAPAPSQWNITDKNCNAFVDYYADTISMYSQGGFLHNTRLGDLGIAATYMDSLVPYNWIGYDSRDDYTELGYHQDLLAWYIAVWFNDTYWSLPDYMSANDNISNIAYTCGSLAICDRLQVKGDPDISGRGMMATYYIAAGLATIYFIVLTLERFHFFGTKVDGSYDGRLSRIRGVSRTIVAFRSSVNEFLDTALIFSAAMLGATIARYATYIKDKEALDADDVLTYPLLGSAFLAVFSIFPCLALQTVADFSKWRFLRLVVWSAIVALAIALEALFKPTFDQFFNDISTYEDAPTERVAATLFQPGVMRAIVWEAECGAKDETQRLRTLVKVGLTIQAVNLIWYLYTVLLGLMVAYRRRLNKSHSRTLNHFKEPSQTWRRISSTLRTFVGIECLVMMWVYLIFFARYRGFVKSRAPSSDKDSDWSFGQVLALAQWIPSILSFVFTWKMGEERGEEEKTGVQQLQHYKHLDPVDADQFSTIRDGQSQEMRIL